ncbi:MAG: DUF4163 domain-containing protein, partial [Clostridiales bacterium]|nr:DUF4163 domain-containing protein [Clostridiales bacterium]
WLIIYQTEMINEFNEKIYKSQYLETLNNMDWVLDESKMGKIENEEIKKGYESLIDGFLTIVRYEETPVVETDWKALSNLSEYISDDLGKTFELYGKIQNYEYERGKLDVDGIMEDMIKTELILEKYESGFIYTLLNKVYIIQTYSLLVGPEGSYLGVFIDKNDEIYEEIINKKNEYPNTLTSKMIENIDKREYNEIMDVFNAIDEHLKFGIKSNNYIINKEFKENDIDYNIFQIVMKDDEEKQNRINSIIEQDIEDFISKFEDTKPIMISANSGFQGNKYLSYSSLITFPGEDYYGSEKYLTLYRTFDYINEKYIKIEDYLGIDFSEFQDYLERVKGEKVDSSPEFQITDRGIDLIIRDEEGEKFIHLNNKDLVPFLSLERLINKN